MPQTMMRCPRNGARLGRTCLVWYRRESIAPQQPDPPEPMRRGARWDTLALGDASGPEYGRRGDAYGTWAEYTPAVANRHALGTAGQRNAHLEQTARQQQQGVWATSTPDPTLEVTP